MQKITIHLNSCENVIEYVQMVAEYPYDLDLVSGRKSVDGKSIVGILTLDLKQEMELRIYSDECDDLLNRLSRFQTM